MNLNETKAALNQYEIDNDEQYYGLDKGSTVSLIRLAESLVVEVEHCKERLRIHLETDHWKQLFETVYTDREIEISRHAGTKLLLEEAQKTLEWYAEELPHQGSIVTKALFDKGQRARETLKRLRGETTV